MADPPSRSDRSDPTRYDTLRDLENQPSEPTRPETVRSSSGPQSGGMEAQQSYANDYNEAAQAHAEKQWQAKQESGERPNDKDQQSEQSESAQADEKKAAYRELAEEITARPDSSMDRQQERQPELGD